MRLFPARFAYAAAGASGLGGFHVRLGERAKISIDLGTTCVRRTVVDRLRSQPAFALLAPCEASGFLQVIQPGWGGGGFVQTKLSKKKGSAKSTRSAIMDDAVVEVQPGHAPVSIDCKMDDAGPDSPGAKPAAADDHDGRYERSFQGGSHIAAQEFVEGGSVDQAVERLMVDDVFAPLLPESISPLPAPSDGREYPLGTTVEDIPDEGEPLAATPRTPLSRTFASRSTLLQTPTLSSRVPMPVKKNDTASAQVPHETEYRDETAGRGGSVLASHNQSGSGIYHAPRPRRRPSALDYLVSVSPVATPRATLEAVYKRAGVGASHVSGFSNMSAPPVLDSLHEGVAHGRVVDPGPQLNWSSSYPGLGGAHTGPLYQRPQALSDIYGSPPMAHSHASLASVTMPQTAPSTVQPGYGAGKLPMSGYQLLAAKLVGGLGGPPITPMYRRFEALNHRLLLYMQADLVDLENELGTLDSKDSMDRGYGAVPASRRHERWANSALGQQRTEILGQIGYKLCQYSMPRFGRGLASFADCSQTRS